MKTAKELRRWRGALISMRNAAALQGEIDLFQTLCARVYLCTLYIIRARKTEDGY